MELLLNLAWLLLALPAFWLWRGASSAPFRRKFTAFQCLLALACMLVILFPVVSATDDLRAMRNEIEESPASKRTIRQASSDKVSAWKWQSPPALAATPSSFTISEQGRLPLRAGGLPVPAMPAMVLAARAPPFLGYSSNPRSFAAKTATLLRNS
jgi:hypothetical protein